MRGGGPERLQGGDLVVFPHDAWHMLTGTPDLHGEENVMAVDGEGPFTTLVCGYFFGGKHRDVLREKQTQFMVAAFGGPNRYVGDTPAFVHMHMYIAEDMSDLRERMLRQEILDEGLGEQIADRWLKVDRAFRHGIVKKSVDECVMKCPGQRPIVARKPAAVAS